MKELFLKVSDTQSKELRNFSTDLYIPRIRISKGQKSFRYRGVRRWNDLTVAAKRARTYLAFKEYVAKNKTKLLQGLLHHCLDLTGERCYFLNSSHSH